MAIFASPQGNGDAVISRDRDPADDRTGPVAGNQRETEPSTPPSRKHWFRRNERWVLPVATIVVLLAVWELLGYLGAFNPLFFSYPSKIWGGLISLAHGTLLSDLRISGTELALGLGLAVLIGTPIGLLVGSIRRLGYALDPIINALYSTPILILTPLLVIIFGLGISSKVANAAISAVFPLIINIIDGVRTTDPTILRAAHSFGARGWRRYRDVIFPSVLPFFMTGLRLAIGRGVIGAVIGEWIASTAGIGNRIAADAAVFNTQRYLAGVMIIVVISVGLMTAVKLLERKLAPWQVSSREQ